MSTQAFAVFLQDLRDGRAQFELSGELADLLAAVKDTGKGQSLTLQVKIKPGARGRDVEKVVIVDNVKVALPKPARGEDFFWVNDDNQLSCNYHSQHGSVALTNPGGPVG